MDEIIILDSITVSLAFSILISKFYVINNKIKFVLYFLILVAENIIFCLFFNPYMERFNFLSQYLMTLITFLYVYDKNLKLYSIYCSIKVLFYMYLLIMLSGSIIFLIFSNINIQSNIIYNILMSVFLLISCYVIKKFSSEANIDYCKNILIIETSLNL